MKFDDERLTTTRWHIAQLNIASLSAPLDSEQLSGFVARLDEINALADESEGFIWRLVTEADSEPADEVDIQTDLKTDTATATDAETDAETVHKPDSRTASSTRIASEHMTDNVKNNATDIQHPFDDSVIVNLSIWKNLKSLHDYVYRSEHKTLIAQRKKWFETMDSAYSVLWWIRIGHTPTVDEAHERLTLLITQGPNKNAFTFKHVFAPP